MFDVSPRCLKIIAAMVWYSGGIVLSFKGVAMLQEAEALAPGSAWFWYAIIIGCGIGVLKVMFIFRKVCLKNLCRIGGLEEPKIWQVFRPGFILFLICMIALGLTMSHAAHNNYPFLIGMAILDFSLAVALLGSSPVFWKHRFN